MCSTSPSTKNILYTSEAILQRVYWNCMVIVAQAITIPYIILSAIKLLPLIKGDVN